ATERVAARREGEWGGEEDRNRAAGLAIRALRPVRGHPVLRERAVDLVTVDDDLGGPYPPGPRAAFAAGLPERGAEVHESDTLTAALSGRQTVIALYADIRAWKGRPGISASAREAVARACAAGSEPVIVLFGHPRLATEVPDGAPVLAAWGGEPL